MTYRSITVIPDEDDLTGYSGVKGEVNPANGIPTLEIARGFRLQFKPEDPEFAVRYLAKIADEARSVVEKIQEAKP